MPDNITPEALPETEQNVPAAGSGGAGTESGENVVEVKDLLKTVLGKEFPTNEAAIKSLQDTYKAVTEQGGTIKTLEQNQVTPDLAKTVETLQNQVRDANFYSANADYNTPEAKALISRFGGNPEEVVKDDLFQKAFTAIKKTADMEQSQSVLHSNPRLGTAQDNMTKASEALKAGDEVAAAIAATTAVLDAYEVKK